MQPRDGPFFVCEHCQYPIVNAQKAHVLFDTTLVNPPSFVVHEECDKPCCKGKHMAWKPELLSNCKFDPLAAMAKIDPPESYRNN